VVTRSAMMMSRIDADKLTRRKDGARMRNLEERWTADKIPEKEEGAPKRPEKIGGSHKSGMRRMYAAKSTLSIASGAEQGQ